MKPVRRCEICGGRLIQEANTPAEARRMGVYLGDLCENPHPITSIRGIPPELMPDPAGQDTVAGLSQEETNG